MMKKITIILLALVAFATSVSAQVRFQFDDGISNTTLKNAVENNISTLLTEINNAQAANRSLNLANVKIQAQAKSGLENLWKSLHFRCEWSTNVQPCLQDATGYEVRQIPVEMSPMDKTYKGELHKELTISFNKQGTLTGVRMAIDNNSYTEIMREGKGVTDERLRREILKFVEDFRSYYVEKDLKAIEDIFSEDALIITGRVIQNIGKTKIEGNKREVRQRIVYSKQNKKEYIRNLAGIFQRSEFVNVDFSDIEIMHHSSKPKYYGVRLRQKWTTQRYSGGTYSDDGYIFLLWDFTDESNPKIHVRTWSPKTNGNVIDEFSPDDFFIP